MMQLKSLVSSLPEKAGPAEAVEAAHSEAEREKKVKRIGYHV